MLHILSAEQHWRKLRGFEWLAKVIRGVQFRDGVEVRSEKRASRRQVHTKGRLKAFANSFGKKLGDFCGVSFHQLPKGR